MTTSTRPEWHTTGARAEPSGWAIAGWGALACLPALLLGCYYYARIFTGLAEPAAMDVAQVARHIARGHGFASSSLSPLAYSQCPRPEAVVTQGPLYPLVLGVVFALAGARDGVSALVSLACHLLAVAAVFVLGYRAFGLRSAWYAALLFALGAPMAGAAVAGLPISLAALTLTLAFVWALRASQEGGGRAALGAGLWAGAAWLTGLVSCLLAPLLALWLGLARGWRRAGVCLAAAGLLAVPWLVRNWLVTGHPLGLGRFELALFTPAFPGSTLQRGFHPDLSLSWVVANHWPGILLKGAGGLASLLSLAAAVGGLAVLLLGAASLFMRLPSDLALMRMTFLGLVGVTAVASGFMAPRLDRLLPLLGVAAVLSGEALARLAAARTHPLLRRSLVGGALVLTAYSAGLQMLGSNLYPRQGGELRACLQRLADYAPPGGLVATDLPWAVAWYADRRALWLPQQPGDERALAARGVRPVCLYLSPYLPGSPPQERLGRWQQAAASGRPPAGYRRAAGWQGGTLFLAQALPAGGARAAHTAPVAWVRPRQRR